MDANELVNVSGGSAFVRKPLGKVTNYCQNPSFNADSILTPLMTNLAPFGSMETAQAGTTEVRRQLIGNSDGSSLAGWNNQNSNLEVVANGGPQGIPTFFRMTPALSTGVWFRVLANNATTRAVVVPGSVLTVSYYIRSNRSINTRVGGFWSLDGGGSLEASAQIGVEASTEWRRVSTQITVPANSSLFSPYAMITNSAVGDSVDITGFLVEQTNQLRPYFNAGMPNEKGFTTEWAGTANASASIMRAATVTLRENLTPDPLGTATTYWSSAGTTGGLSLVTDMPGDVPTAVRTTTTSTGAGLLGPRPMPATPVSSQVSVKMRVRVSGGSITGITVVHRPDGAAASEVSTNVSSGTWAPGVYDIDVTFTTSSTAPNANNYFAVRWASNSAAGVSVDVTRAIFEAGSGGAFFAGSTPNSGDFINAWSGAANASTSAQQALVPRGVAGGGGRVLTRTMDGKLRIIAISNPTISNGAQVAGSSSENPSLVAGVTYTAVARLTISAPITGDTANRTRTIYTLNGLDGVSQQAPNVAGTHLVRFTWTCTSPANSLRLSQGMPGQPDVVWDDFTLVEGNYPDLMPFDGSTPDTVGRDYYWNGIPFASTSSIGYSRQPDQDGGFTYQFAGSQALGVLAGDSAKLGPVPYGIASIKGKVGHVSFDVMSMTEAIPIGATVAIIRFSDGESARLQNNVNIPAGTRGRVGWELDLTMVEDFYGITGFELTNDQAGAGSVTIFDRILVTDSIIRP